MTHRSSTPAAKWCTRWRAKQTGTMIQTPSAPSSEEPSVTMEILDEVAVVTVSAPPHNLLDHTRLRAVADAVHGSLGQARAVVLRSIGRSFCAGANFRSTDAPDPANQASFASRAGALYEQAGRIFTAPLPLVAAVHGAAIGAGFGLAMACDLRVVSEEAWFQANFVALGIHPGFALSATVPAFVGPGRAQDIFLTGRRVGGAEALQIGLAERLVEPGSESDAAIELATSIAKGAPLAVGATRATLRADLVMTATKTLARELAEQERLAGTTDAAEGVAAMLEKRPPLFSGS